MGGAWARAAAPPSAAATALAQHSTAQPGLAQHSTDARQAQHLRKGPPNLRGPALAHHAPDSPVSIDSSTYDCPSSTSPSVGMRAPGSTCGAGPASSRLEPAGSGWEPARATHPRRERPAPAPPSPLPAPNPTTRPRPAHLEHISSVYQLSRDLALPGALPHAAVGAAVAALDEQRGGRRQLAQLGDGLAGLALGLEGGDWGWGGVEVGLGWRAGGLCCKEMARSVPHTTTTACTAAGLAKAATYR